MEKSKLFYYCKDNRLCKYGQEKRPFQVNIDNSGKEILICPVCSEKDIAILDPQPLIGAGIKKENKNWKLIVLVVSIVIIIISIFFIFSGKSKPEPKTPLATPPAKETPVVEAPVATPTPAEPATETVAPEAPAPKAVEEAKPATTKKAVTNVATPKGTQTKKFPGGGKYVGEMKNGQMQGLGTFYYGQHELISPRDMKKRYAEAGDYLIGEFYEGKVVSGKLYDASNTLKEVIMIGR
jgi:hypothetical protein